MKKHEEIKYELLKTELLLTQQQMDKYDQLSSSTKTWAVTLWVAVVGMTVQTHIREMIVVAIIVVIFFGFFDWNNKRFRQDYKDRRNEIGDALQIYFKTGIISDSVYAPVLPSHENKNLVDTIYTVHIGLPYFTLLVLSS